MMFRLQSYCRGAWHDDVWPEGQPQTMEDAIEWAKVAARNYGPARVVNERVAVVWDSETATAEHIAAAEVRGACEGT
jgi:hypothetical protein